MPSQLAHLIHVEDAVEGAFGETPTAPGPHHTHLTLGAQGPDLFYHNRRRKPSALPYGALCHRGRYGAVTAGMMRWALSRGLPFHSEAGMYVTGWALHAVLDRVLHPYINYFSEPPDRRAFARAHAFFERIVDVLLVRRRRGYEASTVDFDRLTDCGPEIPEDLQAMLAAGMRDAFERARTDDQLHPRLQNAYADARDFYRFTNTSGPETLEGALLRAETDRRRRALIALLHPRELPPGYDFANEGHAPWSHPCDEHEVRTTSLFELFDEAVDRGRRLAHGIHAGWEQRIPLFDAQTDAASPSVEALVGNHNLSDDRLLPCTKTCSDPFPLLEIADELCARYKRRK